MWVHPEDDVRESGEGGTGEKGVLADYLNRYRLTLEMECTGLNAEQMARCSVPPSTLSLLGLVRHLAKVEHSWFRRVLQGQTKTPPLYWSEQDRDLASNGALPDPAAAEDASQSWQRRLHTLRPTSTQSLTSERPSTTTASQPKSATSSST
jgi:hypothetical protein